MFEKLPAEGHRTNIHPMDGTPKEKRTKKALSLNRIKVLLSIRDVHRVLEGQGLKSSNRALLDKHDENS